VDEHPVRQRVAGGRWGDFEWDIRAVDPSLSGIHVDGPGQSKPMPQSAPHLLVMIRRIGVSAPTSLLRVVVQLEGMHADDRRVWRKHVRFGPHPHRSLISAFRIDPDRPLHGEAQRHYGPRQLYVRRHQRARASQEILAHLLVYGWQAGILTRDDVVPWLQDYVGPAPWESSADVRPGIVEELLNTFALPLGPDGVRVHVRELWQAERRQGGVDRRLRARDPERLRDDQGDDEADAEAGQEGEDYEGRETEEGEGASGRPPQKGRRPIPRLDMAASDDGSQTLPLREATERLGLNVRKLRYRISKGKLEVVRHGRYLRIPMREIERLTHRAGAVLQKADYRILVALRVLLQAGGSGEGIRAAREWIRWQRNVQRRTPRQVCELLAAHPKLAEKTEVWPELPERIKALLNRIPPTMTWGAGVGPKGG
jgi:hypothetical protein